MNLNPTEKLLALQRLRSLQARKALLERNFGLCFYKPDYDPNTQTWGNGPQDRFHRAGAFKHRGWFAGNRSGKSTGGIAEDCAWLVGERAWLPETDPTRTLGIPRHSLKGIVIAADWDKVDEIFTSERGTEGKLWSMLPRGFVKSKRRNHSGAIELVECVNGHTLRFDTVKSFSVNPMGSESSDYDFGHFDEPCSQDQYKAVTRGLIDRNGKDWFTLTAITEPWIYDMFFPSRRSKVAFMAEGSKWAQRTSMMENKTLTAEAIADYEAQLTEDEKQCRIHGIPLELSGLVYKEFNWDTHVLQQIPNGWNAFDDPPLHYTVYVAIDPHPQTPHHVLFLAVAPSGEWFLFDELYVHCTIQELSEKIKLRLETLSEGKRISRFTPRIICDPYAFNTYPVMGTHGKHLSMADEFGDAGVFISKATKALEQGILAVKRVLKTPGQLYVSPLLEETNSEFTHYAWDTKENKPRDANDHAMENLYRLVLEEPRWLDAAANKGFAMSDIVIDHTDLSGTDIKFDLSLD